MTAVDLADIIADYRIRWACEADLQRGIAAALDLAGVTAAREVVLSRRDRIDLLAGGVGIEVKCSPKSTPQAVYAQMARYASHDQVRELLLVTTRAVHIRLPETAGGKPLAVLLLRGIG